ncbi:MULTISPECIES: hypothetical protein [Burkholderia]|jgi:hypothetical protein|uniref:hypothetical protein n=1 Tax=Burkholderia TaxID=32008 RepID=UPI000052ECA7|nr:MULTISPECIES: hypothetical protein [Burkholderia]NTX19766.1 hypothetical protein [Burkholderia cepacia]ABK13625.1 hypothetical protein Bcen2424_6896 [Burkholderia cenocepacia HI2424]MCF1371667.1 hypothetical protein [Burkholderia cenocepacia]MCF1389180.1 hypothetical protein [Burkholderia cenocepacia]MCG0577823.1 hypothetical protein [Burkholderia cenocepacia]
MNSLTYEQITKRAEREIQDAMQRAASCEFGSYGLGLAVGEARGAFALWEALVDNQGASQSAEARADRFRLEKIAYAKLTPAA